MRFPARGAFAAVLASFAWAVSGTALAAQTTPAPDSRNSSLVLPEKPGTQPTPGAPAFQSSDSITFHILYRVVSRGVPQKTWETFPDQTTLPGQRVQLKITAANAVVLTELLPVPEGPNVVRLRALSHIWLAQGSAELTYMKSMSTVTVGYGEEVFFFPLGSHSESMDIIQLSIRMQSIPTEKR